ncbi:hypothetical protein VNI00_007574 [Paramarasmius palmivorus]|uniref:Elongation factor 1-gamma n=1 Tax=Paramarasmius palmivorus TaxID=297713 RepID=A0AAW0AYW3_9AGAR
MSSIGTLYTTPYQATGKLINAVAALGSLTLDPTPSNYVHFETNKTSEFTSKFPHGKIPAFESKDGAFKLFEGYAIARYVASLAPNANLLGTTPEESALVDQWSHLAETEFDIPSSLVIWMCRGVLAYSKPIHTQLIERFSRTLTTLNTHLTANTYLVGERLTLADLVLASFVQKAVQTTLDKELRSKFVAVIRHFETVVNQPKVKDIFGTVEYAEKAIAFTPPKKEEKPKPAAAPKAEKKEKPKKEADDDDDEPAVPAEPKVKNPLDDLPKSSFNLEDWKRAYSNKDTRGPGGALEWFYENFDKEGFSIYSVSFKYPTELTQTFMSSNQITGFFNRLEASRKYLFGSVGVLGKTNDSIITGALIVRGQDVEPVVNVAPDWESYEYKKLDVFGNEADKSFFEGALAWDLKVGEKEWVDGKNFK